MRSEVKEEPSALADGGGPERSPMPCAPGLAKRQPCEPRRPLRSPSPVPVQAWSRTPNDPQRQPETHPMTPKFNVRQVAVLGAGVMGAQIAAHLANAGVQPVLFDLAADGRDKNG
ncbi:MAG: 3-hydroxyacyl-CoA dehydrogenase NAD-binding domain-containing protein, partial [bacterium]